jgi:hypothetical protein
MPVQWVNRPNLDFRGYCGRIAAGSIAPGDAVRVLPSGATAHVQRIVSMDGDLPHAECGQSVTLTLAEEVDISRGDVITSIDTPVECADQFEVRLLWLSEKPLVAGRSYELKLHHQRANATITSIKYELDINSGAHLSARSVSRNTIAVVNLSVNRALPFESYARNRTLGGLILVDRLSNRLGEGRVFRMAPTPSDVPERSARRVPPLTAPPSNWPLDWPRPVRVFTPPFPVEAIAALPDGPPAAFTWQRQRRRIRRADGPERIAGEWWRHEAETTALRDYWQVEDEAGRRYWLFRRGDGQDEATGDLRWFLHGLF